MAADRPKARFPPVLSDRSRLTIAPVRDELRANDTGDSAPPAERNEGARDECTAKYRYRVRVRARAGAGAATTRPNPTRALRERVVGATAIASAASVVIDNVVVGWAGPPSYASPIKEVLTFHAQHRAA